MIEVLSKQRKLCNRLTAVCNNVNPDYIITFISDRLAKAIHHRNDLRHYRTSSKFLKKMLTQHTPSMLTFQKTLLF